MQLVSISYCAYTSALSLFPDMREHDGLLTPEELQAIEEHANTQNIAGGYLKHYSSLVKTPKIKITSLLQEFINSNDLTYYNIYLFMLYKARLYIS